MPDDSWSEVIFWPQRQKMVDAIVCIFCRIFCDVSRRARTRRGRVIWPSSVEDQCRSRRMIHRHNWDISCLPPLLRRQWMNEWISDRKKTNAIYICIRRERHTRMNARPPKWKVVSDTPISIRWIASLISARFDARPLLHSHVAPKHSSNLWWIRPVSLHSFFFNFSRNLKATTTRTKEYKSISCKSLSFANNTRHLFELVEFTGKPNRPD